VPSGHYSLHCRQQACEHIAVGDTMTLLGHVKAEMTKIDPRAVCRLEYSRNSGAWTVTKATSGGTLT
jgi:hypothetical protein